MTVDSDQENIHIWEKGSREYIYLGFGTMRDQKSGSTAPGPSASTGRQMPMALEHASHNPLGLA
jgi:hypothetical protein